LAGLIVALLSVAAFYLWPDKKWIGSVCLGTAALLGIWWLSLEVKQRLGASRLSLYVAILASATVGGVAGALIWSSSRPQNRGEQKQNHAQAPSARHDDVIRADTGPVAPADHSAVPPLSSADAIDGLSSLGWSIVSGEHNERTFNINSKPLPDVRKSARYFRAVTEPFSILLQNVPSIAGLAVLHDIRQLTSINISGEREHGIHDLAELREFHALTALTVSGTSVFDLTPLAGMTMLRELQLDQSQISDVGPLQHLVELRRLTLNQPLVRDVSALRGMSHLNYLDLVSDPRTDLSCIAELGELRELHVDTNQASMLLGLANSSLTTLRLQGGFGRRSLDLSALSRLTHLQRLDIYTSGELDLLPLRSLTKLSDLEIMGLPSSFSDLNALLILDNLSVTGDLDDLTRLVLAHVKIADLHFLERTKKLESLQLNFSPLSDIAIIGTLTSLKRLDIAGTGIVDIAPLLALPNLRVLGIQQTPARSDVVAMLERRGVDVQR
jgi:Leucine-rich repeat (LRR) protein